MNVDNLSASWNYPTTIHVGIDRVQKILQDCKSLGIKAPLLVTDPGLAKLPMTKSLMEICCDGGLQCELFQDIKSNPTGTNVELGVDAYRRGKHDSVIALGGGSALDAGKAIALLAGQDLSLWDFEDIGDNWSRADANKIAPIIAIPTTAGTGSEVGRASVITDEEEKVKKIIFHPRMLPSIVILDPQLTVGLPAAVTAATGMDALSHNLEALCAPGFHPMADGIALEGIQLVNHYLKRACQDGKDLEARTKMLVASSMGATAFQKGLGAMHALAHPLGALYDAHHGLLNAVLMPYVLVANKSAIKEVTQRAARALNLEQQNFDGFLSWVIQLRQDVGIPNTLAELGIDDSKIELDRNHGNPRSLCRGKSDKVFSTTIQYSAGGSPQRF